jgi:hypothetical protein
MKSSRLERLAPLSGALSVILVFASAGVLGFYEYLPAPEVMQSYFNEHAASTGAAGYLGLIAGFLMMWFSGSLHKGLRQHEGGHGRLSRIAFGATVAASAGILLGSSMLVIASSLAGSPGGIDPQTAVLLKQLYDNSLVALSGLSLAAVTLAAGLIALRTGMFSGWFAWLSVLLAVGLLTPLSWIVMGFAMLWVLGVSIWLYRREAAAK